MLGKCYLKVKIQKLAEFSESQTIESLALKYYK